MKYICCLVFLCIYIFFPNNNSVNDAYSYAASIKWGEELFHPHHLFYNISGYIFYKAISSSGLSIEVLPLMKILNAFFGFLNLLLLWKIADFLQVENYKKIALVLFAGSSFAVMRFATENETYIIPIFFSLLGSLYFIKYVYEQKNIQLFLCSLSGSIACLYHQIHFFWWLGILIGIFIFFRKNKSGFLWYILTALTVPFLYSLTVVYVLNEDLTLNNLFAFIFSEFYKGNTQTGIGLNNFILTGISFIRVFIQVHGNLYFFVKNNLFFILPGVFSLILFIYGIKKMNFTDFAIHHKAVLFTHLLIFLLQLLFAFYAVGNQEFMVMIPFLLAILIGCFKQVKALGLCFFSLGLLIWNVSYAILPNHFYEYTANKDLRNRIVKNPDKIFILNDKNQLANEIYYYTGKYPENVFPCPSEYAIRKSGTAELQSKIREAQNSKAEICTDCTGNEEAFNRAALLKGDSDEKFFKAYYLVPTDTLGTSVGRKIIYKISLK